MIDDFKKINFDGAFAMCGYGEPLLHPDVAEISKKIGEFWGIEIVTNGDPLNKKNLRQLYYSKVSKIVVSMYDGPNQIGKFENGRTTGRPGREAKNFGIFTLSIRLSSNFVKIHTSGVNRMNIWLPGT